MHRMKIRWIGIKLSPPLLLGLQERRDEIEEKREWIEIERNASFYPQEGAPSKDPWDVREATRDTKEIHMAD